MRTPSLALLAPLALLAACSGGAEAAAPPATPAPTTTVVTTTSTTAPADLFAIPADPAGIDDAYVESVANELYRVLGDAGRILMEGGSPEEVMKRYDAVYAPEVATDFLAASFGRAADGFPNIRPDRGNTTLEVVRIREVTPNCILADVIQDASAVLVEPAARTEEVLHLLTARDDTDPDGLNPTPWLMDGLWQREDIEGKTCADL